MRRPGPKPCPVELGASDRAELEKRAASQRRPHREVVRARIVLALADEPSPTTVAAKLGIDPKTVFRWRERYLSEGVVGLSDRKRSGRPVRIPAETRCEVIGMACAKPADFGVVGRNIWTYDSLYETFRKVNPEMSLSRSSLVRTLRHADLKVHRMKYWCHSPDPAFREKVTDICALYRAPPAGSIVLCVDEKTGMQALGRPFPVKMPAPGREGRIDSNYKRNGTRKLLAAFNPHDGEVFAQMRANRKAVDLVEFMEACAQHWSDGEIHVVWDNLNIHYDGVDQRWTRFNKRHRGRFHFHYTPIHASWVNQVELWFGILQKRVLKHGVFDSLDELDERVLEFIDHWNRVEMHPFRWTFKGYPLQVGDQAA